MRDYMLRLSLWQHWLGVRLLSTMIIKVERKPSDIRHIYSRLDYLFFQLWWYHDFRIALGVGGLTAFGLKSWWINCFWTQILTYFDAHTISGKPTGEDSHF